MNTTNGPIHVGVIGAGASGLAACKKLKQYNIDFTCFEKGTKIGGLWRYNNDNNLSAAYKSLYMNTSKRIASYHSFPMQKDMSIYPNHEYVVKYLEDYTDHNDLYENIQFSSTVTEVIKNEDDTFTVVVNDKEKYNFTHLIVAQGRFWNPVMPKIEGDFNGEQLHSFNYSVPTIFEDKNALVVGFGSSGVDISIDATRFAKKVYISTRKVPFVFPRFILGKPQDAYSLGFFRKLPVFFQQILALFAFYLTSGKQKYYGFPKPTPNGNKYVTSSELLPRYATGKIEVLDEIEKFENGKVRFKDGKVKDIDVIVYCTGYKDVFPFFKKDILPGNHHEIFEQLYKNIIHLDHDNLFFVGMVRPPDGSVIPITETQSEWICKLLTGKVRMPSKQERKIINEKDVQKKKKVFKSHYPKNIDYVDYFKYPESIVKEMKKYEIA